MRKHDFKYIYGPVFSWRLGISLGIDLLSCSRKICNFDCVYCQLGKTSRFTNKPKIYVKTADIIDELERLAKVRKIYLTFKYSKNPSLLNIRGRVIDYITFSGRGEPTLAKNLGQAIRAVKKLRIAPVAVLTNSSLINQAGVRENLSYADFVIAKLDAYSQRSLESINRPAGKVRFDTIIHGIKRFKKNFKGKFALQIMFLEANQNEADNLARLAKEIRPDEIQINTPTRACKVRPLSRREIARIKEYFSDVNFTPYLPRAPKDLVKGKGAGFISVYDIHPKKVASFSRQETLKRRGKII